MAVAHIQFNESTLHGQRLRTALRDLEKGLDGLNDVFETMKLMRELVEGQPTTIGQYLADKYGFPDTDVAAAGFAELDSCLAKLNTNASVTDVNAAMKQLFRKFG
jgi:hypothetical protein